jgi:CheY-like chemotaxis protein
VPHTLLLADDSVTIQRVIELTFADEDVRVVAVSDGDEAIATIERTPPDIVLADVGMPGRNGYEVAEHIKRTPHLAHIPVLLLTGAFEPVDQARLARAGCDGVLAKPFEPQLVIGRVNELLAASKDGASRPAALAAAPPPRAAGGVRSIEPRTGEGQPSSQPPAVGLPQDVDEYFERLDRAFANLSSAGADQAAGGHNTDVDGVDWFSTSAPAASAAGPPSLEGFEDLPLVPSAQVDDASGGGTPPPGPQAGSDMPRAHDAQQRTAPVATLPSLADAFAALLAAERAAALPPTTEWPALQPALVDDIVHRVVARVSDQVVRDLAPDIVSHIAERLVKEEIERLKRNL